MVMENEKEEKSAQETVITSVTMAIDFVKEFASKLESMKGDCVLVIDELEKSLEGLKKESASIEAYEQTLDSVRRLLAEKEK
jgi:hypothetical protein